MLSHTLVTDSPSGYSNGRLDLPLKKLSSNDKRRASTVAAHGQAVERVILAMRKRLDEALSLQAMAETALLSRYHFSRVFRQTTGLTPCQFLTALRLEAAKELLLTTQLRVTDVCFEVGYNSLGTFSLQFRQLVGLSPIHFRRLRKETAPSQLESLVVHKANYFDTLPKGLGLRGKINAPSLEAGPTVVSLFSTAIPKGQPVSCTLLTTPGPYQLTPVPDGTYYLFVAMLPQSQTLWDNLPTNKTSLWVGTTPRPLLVHEGKVSGQVDVTLRKRKLTDPPILIDLFYLLTQQVPVDHLSRTPR